ncbi:DNA primase large subunit [Auriscalpium vulgare]|uniref:DNA primase large subunit n=1 Tax=Auriscalpium vulgare TaxID=40419 RepID=A0ACB8S4V4_9AGAM|nr:DNA primase large subunit [Auriscalpium vulgare]
MEKLAKTAGPEVEQHSGLKYPHLLNLYDVPPLEDITIEEFETCAIDRLRVLSEIESSFARNRSFDELKKITIAQCNKHIPMAETTATTVDRDAQRRADVIGHFVLRLAFCRSEELRRRFVKAETTLFRVRYDSCSGTERKNFLNSRDFASIQVTPDEKTLYAPQLQALSFGNERVATTEFYKVKWTRVPDLVERRKVFLRGGYAFVPSREQSSIIFQEFQARLEKALEMTAKALPRLDEDTRLMPVLGNLSQAFLAGVPSDWSPAENNGEEIRADMIDELSRKHFPACMRNLQDNLRRDHHLKHFGRLQYGLFLKTLGLSIEEALLFWRKSFSGFTDDQFNKNYKYNIRHSYGLEGKRANYPGKSCQQILTSDQPGATDSHGCPYRHFSPDNLQTALLSMYSSQGLTSADLPEILSTVKAGHYHVACTRVYEITHAHQGVKKGEGIGSGESVTHPNQYSKESRNLEKALIEEVKMEIDGGDVTMGV